MTVSNLNHGKQNHGVLVTFSTLVTKYLTNDLKEERFVLLIF